MKTWRYAKNRITRATATPTLLRYNGSPKGTFMPDSGEPYLVFFSKPMVQTQFSRMLIDPSGLMKYQKLADTSHKGPGVIGKYKGLTGSYTTSNPILT